MLKKKQPCPATCPDKGGGPDFVCERPLGHSGKHDSLEGGWWTDGGSERLKIEMAAKAATQAVKQ